MPPLAELVRLVLGLRLTVTITLTDHIQSLSHANIHSQVMSGFPPSAWKPTDVTGLAGEANTIWQ